MSLSRILRKAMEDLDNSADSEKSVVMKGPLADIFTKALNIAYAKPDPATGEVKMESQEQDMAMAKKYQAMAALIGNQQDNAPVGVDEATDTSGVTVYGVETGRVADSDIVAVTQDLANAKPDAGRFVLIVNGSNNSSSDTNPITDQELVRLESALESLVAAHGGRVYTSLEDYVSHR